MLERSEHVAEWVRITDEKMAGASCAGHDAAGRRRSPQQQPGGINAASRELGVDRTQAQRAVKVDAIAPEAKEAARAAGMDDNQSALLRVAKAPSPAAQLVEPPAARGQWPTSKPDDAKSRDDAKVTQIICVCVTLTPLKNQD